MLAAGKPFLKKARDWFQPWGRALTNVLYPRVCRVCDVFLPDWQPDEPMGEWFCSECQGLLRKVESPYCARCGECYDGALVGPFHCENCADRNYDFEFAVAGYHAEGPVRELIHAFKYARDLSLRGCLAELMTQALDDDRLVAENLSDWVMVPVPLHHARHREREFNQSEELCLQWQKRFSIPTVNALKRRRNTGHQASLTRKQRLDNLMSAFSLKRSFQGQNSPLAGRKVLLVDDVFTTGATTDACARVLKRQAGVEKVVVITVARG